MPSFTSVAALLSVAALVSAQGRFPCSQLVGGVVTEVASRCVGTATPDYPIQNAGQVNYPGYKYNGAAPVNSQCVKDAITKNWFCGYVGAVCTDGTQCDNGACTNGVCTGAVGAPCATDSACLGHSYCTDPSGFINSQAVCGGVSPAFNAAIDPSAANPQGAFCSDGSLLPSETGNLCTSGYCDPDQAACAAAPVVSNGARARSRRSDLATRGAKCPAGHSACAVQGLTRGFECIDVASNLEQCGACANAGGVDCTALPGVDAVGCVAGKCEIWACAEGFAWDASSASCAVALTM